MIEPKRACNRCAEHRCKHSSTFRLVAHHARAADVPPVNRVLHEISLSEVVKCCQHHLRCQKGDSRLDVLQGHGVSTVLLRLRVRWTSCVRWNITRTPALLALHARRIAAGSVIPEKLACTACCSAVQSRCGQFRSQDFGLKLSRTPGSRTWCILFCLQNGTLIRPASFQVHWTAVARLFTGIDLCRSGLWRKKTGSMEEAGSGAWDLVCIWCRFLLGPRPLGACVHAIWPFS
jgi:hypothetical protein